MGFFSAIGGVLGKTNDTSIKKEETEFEKAQKYIKELEEKMEREKNLKSENKLKNINLDEGEKKLNWKDLRSKPNIKEDLAGEKEEDKWKKLDKMLEDI